eukprot:6213896-Pleurochrysis_carterae.AAC.2
MTLAMCSALSRYGRPPCQLRRSQPLLRRSPTRLCHLSHWSWALLVPLLLAWAAVAAAAWPNPLFARSRSRRTGADSVPAARPP